MLKKHLFWLQKKLGNRKLIWFGKRGTDSRSYLKIANFSESYSIIAPLDIDRIYEVSLETMTQTRIDLDGHRLEQDNSPSAKSLFKSLYDATTKPSCIISYRPSEILTVLSHTRQDTTQFLGLSNQFAKAFEYKPWVEMELKKLGLNVIPWTYSSEPREKVKEMLHHGPVVMRRNFSESGSGFVLINEITELPEINYLDQYSFVGLSPYLYPNIPINLSACIFAHGEITYHPASMQLIGLSCCTNNPFGYCGNDFSQIKNIGRKVVIKLQNAVNIIGKWLFSKGYLGAFGIDVLIYQDKIFITEVNPRLQGSSDISSMVDEKLGRPDIFLDHLMSFLGKDNHIDKMSLSDIIFDQYPVSQVICHNIQAKSLIRNQAIPNVDMKEKLMLLSQEYVTIETNAILYRLVVQHEVTKDGISIDSNIEDVIHKNNRNYFISTN